MDEKAIRRDERERVVRMLESAQHPSPYSTYGGYLGSRDIVSKTMEFCVRVVKDMI